MYVIEYFFFFQVCMHTVIQSIMSACCVICEVSYFDIGFRENTTAWMSNVVDIYPY